MDRNLTLRLLRVEEAAEFLNVKPSTIRAWLLRRRLPFVRVGKRAVRIPLEALEGLISENLIPARESHNATR
jgi:excisionase family DNA binding protein